MCSRHSTAAAQHALQKGEKVGAVGGGSMKKGMRAECGSQRNVCFSAMPGNSSCRQRALRRAEGSCPRSVAFFSSLVRLPMR